MAKIRITAGVFGWNHGTYELVKAGDPPIEVDEALAQRLVEKGVAAYVTPPVDTPSVMEYDTHPDEESAAAEPTGKAYHIGMTAKELREIGEGYGLTFKQGISKAEMVEKLDALFADLDLAETEQGEEEAPTFDATEAVQ
jgi:hypothetical protein